MLRASREADGDYRARTCQKCGDTFRSFRPSTLCPTCHAVARPGNADDEPDIHRFRVNYGHAAHGRTKLVTRNG